MIVRIFGQFFGRFVEVNLSYGQSDFTVPRFNYEKNKLRPVGAVPMDIPIDIL